MEETIDAELRLGPPGGGGDAAVAAQPARKRSSSSVVKSDDHVAAPASKVQVVGWPPVRACRKNAVHAEAKGQGRQLYVKVSMDGAPYLRKVDLRTFAGYSELRDALFACFSSSARFAVAYEDKDGDLMLAGDVPWDMFICSCKKLRIMRGTELKQDDARYIDQGGVVHM